jgi:hypothetical protein
MHVALDTEKTINVAPFYMIHWTHSKSLWLVQHQHTCRHQHIVPLLVNACGTTASHRLVQHAQNIVVQVEQLAAVQQGALGGHRWAWGMLISSTIHGLPAGGHVVSLQATCAA